jgi:hypothetical protein
MGGGGLHHSTATMTVDEEEKESGFGAGGWGMARARRAGEGEIRGAARARETQVARQPTARIAMKAATSGREKEFCMMFYI